MWLNGDDIEKKNIYSFKIPQKIIKTVWFNTVFSSFVIFL